MSSIDSSSINSSAPASPAQSLRTNDVGRRQTGVGYVKSQVHRASRNLRSRLPNFSISKMKFSMPNGIFSGRKGKMYYSRVDENYSGLSSKEKKVRKEEIRSNVESKLTVFQNRIREIIQERKIVKADKIRALLKQPIKGGVASRDNPGFLTGGDIQYPENKKMVNDFRNQSFASRDEHRRVLETFLAEGLLSKTNPNYDDLLDSVTSAEDKLFEWVNSHRDENKKSDVNRLLDALYGDNKPGVYKKNHQATQFINGIYQAKKDGNELMLSATRCAGLIQCIGWLGENVEKKTPGRVQNSKNNLIYSKHILFTKEGRGRKSTGKTHAGTHFKGIIKDEKFVSIDDRHKNSKAMTKAQIANKPKVSLLEKNAPDGVEGWLADDKVRSMPFVNSVSGLGLIASLPDALGLFPDGQEEKLQLFGAIAAAQLYTVGGHSFFEFMEGIRIGQDAKSYDINSKEDGAVFIDNIEKGTLREGDHGYTFDNFIDSIPDEVLFNTARQMDKNDEIVKVGEKDQDNYALTEKDDNFGDAELDNYLDSEI